MCYFICWCCIFRSFICWCQHLSPLFLILAFFFGLWKWISVRSPLWILFQCNVNHCLDSIATLEAIAMVFQLLAKKRTLAMRWGVPFWLPIKVSVAGDELVTTYGEQVQGLVAGGVLVIEAIFDAQHSKRWWFKNQTREIWCTTWYSQGPVESSRHNFESASVHELSSLRTKKVLLTYHCSSNILILFDVECLMKVVAQFFQRKPSIWASNIPYFTAVDR